MKYEVFEGAAARAKLEDVRLVYAEVYAEAPYSEGPEDVDDFVEGWPRRASMPAFRLVLAYDGDAATGMAFGHQLPPGSRWWSGLLDEAPGDVTEEWPGRTFAVIELAVRGPWRRSGVGRRLLAALLESRPEERVTLLVRPEDEARPAQAMYEQLGYGLVGRVRPYEGAPLYEAMVLPLPRV